MRRNRNARDRVHQAGLESFPASDPPSWTSGLAGETGSRKTASETLPDEAPRNGANGFDDLERWDQDPADRALAHAPRAAKWGAALAGVVVGGLLGLVLDGSPVGSVVGFVRGEVAVLGALVGAAVGLLLGALRILPPPPRQEEA